MAKITELPNATAVNDTDLVPIVQDGETKQIPRGLFIQTPPDDLKITNNLLQLSANGEAVGAGITVATPTFVESTVNSLAENLKYRVIADITLTEDTQKIEITKDDEGSAFALKSVFVLFRGKFTKTAACNMFYAFNGGQIYQMYSQFSPIADKYYGLWARSERIGTFETSSGTTSIWQSFYPQSLCTNFLDVGTGQGLAGNNTEMKGDICVRSYNTACSVKFGCYTDATLMAAGSNILIVGVDNDG